MIRHAARRRHADAAYAMSAAAFSHYACRHFLLMLIFSSLMMLIFLLPLMLPIFTLFR